MNNVNQAFFILDVTSLLFLFVFFLFLFFSFFFLFSMMLLDLDCFGLSGPWMRVHSSDSVIYAVINRGSYLSITGCVCVYVRHMHGPLSSMTSVSHVEKQPHDMRQKSLISLILSISFVCFSPFHHIFILSPSLINTSTAHVAVARKASSLEDVIVIKESLTSFNSVICVAATHAVSPPTHPLPLWFLIMFLFLR